MPERKPQVYQHTKVPERKPSGPQPTKGSQKKPLGHQTNQKLIGLSREPAFPQAGLPRGCPMPYSHIISTSCSCKNAQHLGTLSQVEPSLRKIAHALERHPWWFDGAFCDCEQEGSQFPPNVQTDRQKQQCRDMVLNHFRYAHGRYSSEPQAL